MKLKILLLQYITFHIHTDICFGKLHTLIFFGLFHKYVSGNFKTFLTMHLDDYKSFPMYQPCCFCFCKIATWYMVDNLIGLFQFLFASFAIFRGISTSTFDFINYHRGWSGGNASLLGFSQFPKNSMFCALNIAWLLCLTDYIW